MKLAVMLVALAGLAACRAPEAQKPETPAGDPDARYRMGETMGVTLPTGQRFTAEVAREPDDRARGLMFRTRMGPDQAMLFPYEAPQPLAVWMKNVQFPIDVLFLVRGPSDRQLRVVHLLEAIPPCTTPSCPSYPSPVAAQYFLELPAYTVSAQGLRADDLVALERAP